RPGGQLLHAPGRVLLRAARGLLLRAAGGVLLRTAGRLLLRSPGGVVLLRAGGGGHDDALRTVRPASGEHDLLLSLSRRAFRSVQARPERLASGYHAMSFGAWMPPSPLISSFYEFGRPGWVLQATERARPGAAAAAARGGDQALSVGVAGTGGKRR